MDSDPGEIDPEILVVFTEEALEALGDLDAQFVQLEERPDDQDALAAIFRVMHTIKGNSAFFGLMRVKKLAHQMEDLMALMRDGQVAATSETVAPMLRGLDLLRGMLTAVQDSSREMDGVVADQYTRLLDELKAQCESRAGHGDTSLLGILGEIDGLLGGAYDFQQVREGMKDVRARLAQIATEGLVSGSVATPEPSGTRAEESVDPLAALQELVARPMEEDLPDDEASRAAEWLRALGEGAPPEELEIVVRMQGEHDRLVPEVGFGEFLAEGLRADLKKIADLRERRAAAGEEAAAQGQPAAGGTKKASVARSMRVDESKIDQFLDYVGELIIVREMFVNVGKRVRESAQASDLSSEYQRALEAFTLLSHSLQDSIMQIRKVPVKAALQKVPRLARDLAQQRCKEVKVRLSGEDVPIDKSLLETLEGPLTHMVRNAVDHGIESPDKRVAAGKPSHGTLTVAAFEDPDHIRIEVGDDGGGIHVGKLKAKAVAAGIITDAHSARMSDEEARMLLFAAGLSTAEQVTDVSGRGVGMDVVRRNVTDLGGEISLRSELGKGTTFCLMLPKAVTVQILDGFLVCVSGHRFVLPLATIRESFRPETSHVVTVAERGEFISRRGQVFPLVRFGDVLRLGGERRPASEAIVVSVDVGAGTSAGLLVDEVLGVQQVVLREVHGIEDERSPFSGGAVLGDGRVAMVVDVDQLGAMV